jgi:hypothetical protein
MKRLVLFLAVALLVIQSLAWAQNQGEPDPCATSPTFQAYGELTCNYSVGCATVSATISSTEIKVTEVTCIGDACPSNTLMINPDDTSPGLNIGSSEYSLATTEGHLDQVTAVGSNAMTMLGTASVCGPAGAFSSDTGFLQNQNITLESNFSGSGNCAGVGGSAVYNASQTFKAAPKGSGNGE